jgi:hypothetical protein
MQLGILAQQSEVGLAVGGGEEEVAPLVPTLGKVMRVGAIGW